MEKIKKQLEEVLSRVNELIDSETVVVISNTQSDTITDIFEKLDNFFTEIEEETQVKVFEDKVDEFLEMVASFKSRHKRMFTTSDVGYNIEKLQEAIDAFGEITASII